jgi:hypothetical protein
MEQYDWSICTQAIGVSSNDAWTTPEDMTTAQGRNTGHKIEVLK